MTDFTTAITSPQKLLLISSIAPVLWKCQWFPGYILTIFTLRILRTLVKMCRYISSYVMHADSSVNSTSPLKYLLFRYNTIFFYCCSRHVFVIILYFEKSFRNIGTFRIMYGRWYNIIGRSILHTYFFRFFSFIYIYYVKNCEMFHCSFRSGLKGRPLNDVIFFRWRNREHKCMSVGARGKVEIRKKGIHLFGEKSFSETIKWSEWKKSSWMDVQFSFLPISFIWSVVIPSAVPQRHRLLFDFIQKNVMEQKAW